MSNKKQDHPWLGVDAIIEKDGLILLVKRSASSKVYPGLWSLPSGKVEWGEEVSEAVKREVLEETGFDVEVEQFVGRYYDARGRHPSKTMICLPHTCKIIGGELKSGSDAAEANWFSPAEIRSLDLAFDHKKMLEDEGLL